MRTINIRRALTVTTRQQATASDTAQTKKKKNLL
jgi:hypothetical protein